MSVHSIRELAKELVPYHVTSVALPAAKHLKSLAFDDSNFAAFREAEAIPAIVNALRAGSASPIAQALQADRHQTSPPGPNLRRPSLAPPAVLGGT